MIYKNRTSKWMLGTYVVAATLIGTSALLVAGCESQVSKENEPAKSEARSKDATPIFTVVEVQPEYPGGNAEMFKFLGRKIKYPTAASKANVGGKVFVSFVVTDNGDIKDVTILKGIGFGCDEEAARVVSMFPKWTPGRQNGKAVNVKYTIPIKFQLAEVGEDTSTDKETTVVGFKPVSQSTAETSKPQVDIISGTKFDSKIQIRWPEGEPFADKQPMYILDGETLENGSQIKTMDPNTIESINVLKGAEATKIYGSRAANGVISVTTKDK